MNEYLQEMMESGLEVNWTTLLIGWEGPGSWGSLVNLRDATEIACRRLCERAGVVSDLEVSLAGAVSGEEAEAAAALRALSEEGPVDPRVELRKWRLVLLKRELRDLPEDPIYGLIRLTAFWATFAYPEDSPHLVQGRESSLRPREYYSQENFRRAVAAHRAWVANEELALRLG